MKGRLVLIALAAVVLLSSCVTHTHVVGGGSRTGEEVVAYQWYLVWGLVPLNDVNTQDLAGSAADYTIVTQYTPVDAVLSYIGSVISLQRRTVKVTK